MDSKDERQVWFLGITLGTILIFMCSMMFTISTYYSKRNEIYTSRGYVQRTVQGWGSPIWTKDKE